MGNPRRKYLRVVEVELEDLRHDIERLCEHCTKEREARKLTNYVFLENLATFQSELLGVDAFDRILRGVDPDAFPTVAALAEHLKGRFHEAIRSSGLPEALERLVERKLTKVVAFVEE